MEAEQITKSSEKWECVTGDESVQWLLQPHSHYMYRGAQLCVALLSRRKGLTLGTIYQEFMITLAVVTRQHIAYLHIAFTTCQSDPECRRSSVEKIEGRVGG